MIKRMVGKRIERINIRIKTGIHVKINYIKGEG
jgi:hypothetical protein